jgi:hypothetical protein
MPRASFLASTLCLLVPCASITSAQDEAPPSPASPATVADAANFQVLSASIDSTNPTQVIFIIRSSDGNKLTGMKPSAINPSTVQLPAVPAGGPFPAYPSLPALSLTPLTDPTGDARRWLFDDDKMAMLYYKMPAITAFGVRLYQAQLNLNNDVIFVVKLTTAANAEVSQNLADKDGKPIVMVPPCPPEVTGDDPENPGGNGPSPMDDR